MSMTPPDVRAWLISRIAANLKVAPGTIDTAQPIADMGLSSEQAVRLAAELEDLLGRRLGAELLYDHPSIDAVCGHLCDPGPEPATAVAEGTWGEPIAIVGIGCRFPGGGTGPDAFWQFLEQGGDAVTEVPADRWDSDALYDPAGGTGRTRTRWGAFLDGIDLFDPAAFGITPAEAKIMDPQQRLLLEVAWHAIEDAGMSWRALAGSRTGVFVGISGSDYGAAMRASAPIDATSATGSALSIAANRISYAFDLVGPSMAIDTACSSSLAAVHLACRSLHAGEATMALAGGVNLMLNPDLAIAFTAAGLMSPTGRCRAFADEADGYVRGEGVGLVVLKTLERALADGDRIYARIMGSAMVQDGRSNGLMAPRGDAQVAVIRAARAAAGIDDDAIDYVEAHGTGTAVGDVIEAATLARTAARRATTSAPVLVGSVKTNLGHLEPAAGIAGLIKLALCIWHDRLVPSLHCAVPSRAIPFDEANIAICTSGRDWPRPDRVGGINSFGFGGTNVHAVLAAAPVRTAHTAGLGRSTGGPLQLALSAHDAPSLDALAAAYRAQMSNASTATIEAMVAAAAKRTPLPERLVVTANGAAALQEGLRERTGGQTNYHRVRARARANARVAFVFSGQGAIGAGAGRDLFEEDAVFRQHLLSADDALRPHLGASILPALFSDQAAALLRETRWAQPALFAIQVAISRHLMALGMTPEACVGHSVGEVAAAHLSGRLALADAARLVAVRAQAMQAAHGLGAMVAISGDDRLMDVVIRDWPGCEVAAVNAPGSWVIAGDAVVVARAAAGLAEQGAQCQQLPVDYAFHSAFMDEPAASLRTTLGDMPEAAPERLFISATAPDRSDDALLDAAYWHDNVRDPVRFAAAIGRLRDRGFDQFVEIGPHPVLGRDLKTLTRDLPDGSVHATLRRGGPARAALDAAVAGLFATGALPALPYDVAQATASPQSRSVPPYVWAQRTRHWALGAAPAAPQGIEGLGEPMHIAGMPGAYLWQGGFDRASQPWLADHAVLDMITVPAAAMIDLFVRAGVAVTGQREIALRRVEFTRLITLDHDLRCELQLLARARDDGFDLSLHTRSHDATEWTATASAHVTTASIGDVARIDPDAILAQCYDRYPPALLYDLLRTRGLGYGPGFRGVVDLAARRGEALGRIAPPGGGRLTTKDHLCAPAVVDSALHPIAACFGAAALRDGSGTMLIPVGLDGFTIHRADGTVSWSHCRAVETPGDDRQFDVTLADDTGAALVTISGLRFSGGRQDVVRQREADHAQRRWLYAVEWRDASAEPIIERAGTGAILVIAADPWSDRLADRLVERWQARGFDCVRATRGLSPGEPGGDPVVQEGFERDRFVELLGRCGPSGWSEIVLLGSADAAPASEAMALVALVQALTVASMEAPPRVSIVTRGAVSTEPAQPCLPARAVMWGLSRALLLECPDLAIRRIDLDLEEPSSDATEIAWLDEELIRDTMEDQVARRAGQRRVARLISRPEFPEACGIDPQGIYIVTGGSGALGTAAAQALLARGGKSIVLASRSAPGTWVENHRPDGVRIVHAQCDVGDPSAVTALLRRAAQQGPLRGIIHAAGVLDDRSFLKMDRAAMARVFAAKVDGAQILSDATATMELDFLVFMSSAASILGSPGQANYCAANAYLDALAADLRAQGRRALSISWGPWAGDGLARDLGERDLVKSGLITMISPGIGSALLVALLASRNAHVAVLPFNIAALLQFMPATSGLAFFSELAGDVAATRSVRDGALQQRPDIDQAYVQPRNDIETAIVGMWQRALGMRGIGVRDDLFALGGDSVFANQVLVRINETYGVRIDPQTAFDRFTVEALATIVEAQLISFVDTLSDEEVEAMLGEADPADAGTAQIA